MIRVEKYSKRYHSAWDDFVAGSMNGTAFHSQTFLDYHPDGRFEFNHLLFFDGDAIVAVLPGGRKQQGAVYESPLGASYGSFVTNDISAQTALDIVDAFESYVTAERIQEVFLTAAPVVYQPLLTQNLEFALLYKGFSYQRHYISHVISVEKNSSRHNRDFLSRIHPTARRNIRQQQKRGELVVEHVEKTNFAIELAEFYPIMLENKLRHDTTPTHTLEELLKLHELLPNLIEYFSCRKAGELIAGFLLFAPNPRVFLSFYPMLRYEYSHLKPIYLLTAVVYDWAEANGFDFIDLGVSQDTNDENPMTPALSLIHFKEKFDSRGVLRSTLHKDYD